MALRILIFLSLLFVAAPTNATAQDTSQVEFETIASISTDEFAALLPKVTFRSRHSMTIGFWEFDSEGGPSRRGDRICIGVLLAELNAGLGESVVALKVWAPAGTYALNEASRTLTENSGYAAIVFGSALPKCAPADNNCFLALPHLKIDRNGVVTTADRTIGKIGW